MAEQVAAAKGSSVLLALEASKSFIGIDAFTVLFSVIVI